MVTVRVTANEIDISKAIAHVMHPDCGGISVFIGTVRDNYNGQQVCSVNVEAYDVMAVTDLERIAKGALEKHRVRDVSIQHRTGQLKVGEVIVVIAVSAPHRKEAFDACREIIENLKQTTPIWKQEYFDSGHGLSGEEKHGKNG